MKKTLLLSKLITITTLFVILGVQSTINAREIVTTDPIDIYGNRLQDGDLISASDYFDPDIFIVKFSALNTNDGKFNGAKRLFLNPAIFNMYGHLGGWDKVKKVTPEVRNSFVTSGLFRNCETNTQAVWATEIIGEDDGVLHHVNISGADAVAQDANFFMKVFCINSLEEGSYPKSTVDYTAVLQVPIYGRIPVPTLEVKYFLMQANNIDEKFVIKVTDKNIINRLIQDMNGSRALIVNGHVKIGNGGFNDSWSWHLDPDSINLAEMAMELCDARPSYVESHLPEWMSTVVRYCPWGFRAVSMHDTLPLAVPITN